MTLDASTREELYDLLDLLFDEQLDNTAGDRLAKLLAGSDEAQWIYVAEMNRHADLAWNWGILNRCDSRSRLPDGTELKVEGRRGKAEEESLPSPFGRGAGGEGGEPKVEGGRWKAEEKAGQLVDSDFSISPSPPLPISPSSTPPSPFPCPPFVSLPSFLPTTPLGNVAFSYAMSALLVAMGLFIFSLMSASSPRNAVATNQSSTPQNHKQSNVPTPELEIKSIARITGMVDCRWVNENEAPFHNKIKLHDKFALKSGLMEITYKTGARVILQGPCSYEVESTTGGYLSLGKLTALVESRSRLPSGTSTSRLPDGTLHTDLDTTKSRPAESRPAGYFAIRTPTAVVTDLGTEFGVEVVKDGETRSHVFQGKVTIVGLDADSRPCGDSVTLGANQSARASYKKKVAKIVVVSGNEGNSTPEAGHFVRANSLKEIPLKPFRRWQAFSEELRKRDDLLAYYDFQRDSDEPRDESGCEIMRNRANTGPRFDGRVLGTLRMGMAAGRFPGKHALLFGGVDDGVHVNIPVACRRITVAAWVNIEDLAETSGLLMSDVFNSATPGAIHWQFARGVEGEIMLFGAAEIGGTRSKPVFHDPISGRWRHVAATRDGVSRQVRLYIDGDLAGETTTASDADFQIGAAMIGAWGNQSQRRTLHGRIDEIAIFNRAFSDQEIHKLYNAGKPEDSSNASQSDEPPGKEAKPNM